jgi:hypothetical protein
MISLIKKKDIATQKYIFTSEKIKKIENYSYRYLPIEHYKEMTPHTVACYVRNIGKKTLEEYIQERSEHKRLKESIHSLTLYLQKSIQTMNDKEIYHFNLTNQSIVLDETNDVPIVRWLHPPETTTMTFPIEYYIYHDERTDEIMTNEIANEIFNTFTANDKEVFDRKYQRITDHETQQMRERYNQYMVQFIGKTTRDIKTKLEPFKKTWDTYLLSVVFFVILTDLDEATLKEYINYHKRIILSLPDERKYLTILYNEFDAIYNQYR